MSNYGSVFSQVFHERSRADLRSFSERRITSAVQLVATTFPTTMAGSSSRKRICHRRETIPSYYPHIRFRSIQIVVARICNHLTLELQTSVWEELKRNEKERVCSAIKDTIFWRSICTKYDEVRRKTRVSIRQNIKATIKLSNATQLSKWSGTAIRDFLLNLKLWKIISRGEPSVVH